MDGAIAAKPGGTLYDEIPDLHLRLWVNDRLQQDDDTAKMTFSVAQIIAHESRFATREPGDFMLTGTPKRIGCFRQPPIYLKPGDVVRCAIEGIGEITNRTQAAAATREDVSA